MEQLLSRFAVPGTDPAQLLVQLVDEIRPVDVEDLATARRNLQALCYILSSQQELRCALREAIWTLLQTYRHSELYTATGIQPNTGFVSEAFRRLGHTLLPEVLDSGLLRSVLRQTFHRPGDRHWVIGVGEDVWQQLIVAIRFDEAPTSDTFPQGLSELLRSLRVLSYWIAACGMEPELLRLEPSLETYESPFVAQNCERTAYIEAYPEHWGRPGEVANDERHLHVLFGQCQQVIERVRRNAAKNGTSIRLTYHLQRLRQFMQRCERMLDILDELQNDTRGTTG